MGTLIEVIGSQRNRHEVMITGYNNNGTMEYFDPQTAIYGTKFPSEFHNVLEIARRK